MATQTEQHLRGLKFLPAAKGLCLSSRTLEGVGATQTQKHLRGLKFLQAAKAAFVCPAAPLRVSEFGEGIIKETGIL